jgi:hypothetical protein
MNIKQILKESVGLSNRKYGDVFVNPDTGEDIIFQDLRFFPESGTYADPKDMQEQITQLEGQIGQNIQWVNLARSVGAFGVAYFEGVQGPLYFGRYFAKINPYFKQNFWPNSDLLGYTLKRAASTKTRSGYYPSDILSDTMEQTPESILEQVSKKFGEEHPLTQITQRVVGGDAGALPHTFDSKDVEFTAFRDVFAELLQPVAIIRGLYSGNAAEAEKLFLDGASYSECTINFNTSKTAGLYDSVLVAPNGTMVKVSSKGGAGAAASSSNLMRSVQEIRNSGHRRLLSRYRRELEILEVIDDENYALGPLKLGVEFDIITSEEAQMVVSYLQDPTSRQSITDNLKQLILHRTQTARDASKIHRGYALLAAVAYRVCEYVNTQTRFNDAATTVLNNGSLIQCYTQAQVGDGTITLTGFNTVFPTKVASSVTLSADKTYYNTGNKGKLTFVISGL